MVKARLDQSFSPTELKKRRQAAQTERDTFQPLLDDCWTYAQPHRKSVANSATGEDRMNAVFDQTAIDASVRFAGRLQQDFWPPHQQNYALAPGAVVTKQADREAMLAQLAPITSVTRAYFDGRWDMAFHEMAQDLVAGTGAMLMNPPQKYDDRLWCPISVSIEEIVLEAGYDGGVSGIFWKRTMTGRQVKDAWPDGKFDTAISEKMDANPEAPLTINIDTVLDAKKRRWRMVVSFESQEAEIWHTASRTCPWLTPRYFRLPGEVMGRGPLILAMPEIKTLNTVKRLYLAAASIAMGGIYTAVDDGVFNVDLATFEPFSVWKVASNGGGSRGPSISRFQDPRIDLSSLVVKEMQMGVKATLMDEGLPPDGAAVRSATEIIERVKRMVSDNFGAHGRLTEEIIVPAVKRVIELAYEAKLLAEDIEIDRLLVSVEIQNPITIARNMEGLQRAMQWLEMVEMQAQALGDPGLTQRICKVEDLLLEAANMLGVDPRFKVSAEERQKMADEESAAAEAAQAAAAMAAGGEMAGMMPTEMDPAMMRMAA